MKPINTKEAMDSDIMVVGGICACCGRHSPALYTCKACGSRCCPRCINPKTGFCRLCSGIKRV